MLNIFYILLRFIFFIFKKFLKSKNAISICLISILFVSLFLPNSIVYQHSHVINQEKVKQHNTHSHQHNYLPSAMVASYVIDAIEKEEKKNKEPLKEHSHENRWLLALFFSFYGFDLYQKFSFIQVLLFLLIIPIQKQIFTFKARGPPLKCSPVTKSS